MEQQNHAIALDDKMRSVSIKDHSSDLRDLDPVIPKAKTLNMINQDYSIKLGSNHSVHEEYLSGSIDQLTNKPNVDIKTDNEGYLEVKRIYETLDAKPPYMSMDSLDAKRYFKDDIGFGTMKLNANNKQGEEKKNEL